MSVLYLTIPKMAPLLFINCLTSSATLRWAYEVKKKNKNTTKHKTKKGTL